MKPRHKCPKCKGDDLDVTCINRDDYSMTERVECCDCGHNWIETWGLTLEDIEDEDD